MLKVLDIILNKSYHKLGFQNGKGETYEGILTTSSIQQAQKYYDLLTRVKNGEASLKIDEKIKQVLPEPVVCHTKPDILCFDAALIASIACI